MDFLNKFAELIVRVFSKEWTALAASLGGLLLIFFACLFVSLAFGDFINNLRAANMVISGQVEEGLDEMDDFLAYSSDADIIPPVDAFDFDRIFARPYSYSAIKKLPFLIGAFALFFAGLSVLSLLALGVSALALVFLVLIEGLILYIIASLVSARMLKNADRAYQAMFNIIYEINKANAAADKLCDRAYALAERGGVGFEELNALLTEVNEQKKSANSYAEVKLIKALDLIEKAAETISA